VENTKNVDHVFIFIDIIVYSKLFYPQAVLAPKRSHHALDARPTDLGWLVAKMPLNAIDDSPLIVSSETLNIPSRFLSVLDVIAAR
jgi:hypothetical protein